MPTSIECTYCREIDAIESKMLENPTDIHCIIDHKGFQSVCLDVWVLQTAYHNYRQKYGDAEDKSVTTSTFCRRYRFMAYRQLTGWCWGWLGKNVRVVLPSCAVSKIREIFPSSAYAGFKYPQLS